MNEFDSASEFSDEGESGYDVQWVDINHAQVYVNGEEGDEYLNQVHNNYFQRDAQSTFNLIRVAQVYISRIPHSITKYRTVRRMEHGCRSALLKLLDVTVKRIATVLFPADGRGLFSAYCAQKSTEGKLAKRMVNLLRRLRNGSIEKRVVRACLFSSIRGRVLYDMMTRDINAIDADVREGEQDEDGGGEDNSGDPGGMSGGEHGGGAPEFSHDAGAGGSGGSTEGLLRNDTGERGNEANTEVNDGTKKYISGGFQRLQKSSRNDWLTLITTGGLSTEKKLRSHFSDEVLVRMLHFLFRGDNVQLLSWGTKRVVYGGAVHRFPAVVRKSSGEGLWRRFNEEIGMGNNVRRVGRTVFRAIVAYLTKGQLEARSCIDYYQDSLVNENIKLLKEILNKETDPGHDSSNLVKRIDAVGGFLKYNYRNHLQYNSNDGYHDISHGLLRGSTKPGMETCLKKSTCPLCLCVPRVVDDVEDVIVSNNPSIKEALVEAKHRFKLYMGHCIRSKVQQDRITSVMEDMKTVDGGEMCVLYVDFKMKKLPKKLREPSQDWFGKRGMSWHGAAVFSCKSEEKKRKEREANEKLNGMRRQRKGKKACKKSVSMDGRDIESGELDLFFIDSVIENTGVQDTMTTANVIDCICIRLKKELRELKDVVFISDNAPNYVNLTLPLICYYIFKAHGLRLLEVLHPDAQQSKNMVDAHFGIGSRQRDKFICEKDLVVITPDDVAEALVYDGGIKGTAVDFIKVNRNSANVRKWFTARDKTKNSMFDSIGTCGDILFHELGNGGVHVITSQYSGAETKHFLMEEASIIVAGENGEPLARPIRKRGKGKKAELDEGEGDGVAEAGGAAGDERTETALERAEIEEIADTIAGGAKHRIQDEYVTVKYSRRPALGIAPYTGASIKFMSTIQKWDRSVFLDCREAFTDAQAETEAEEEGLGAQRDDGEQGTAADRGAIRQGGNVTREAMRPSQVPFDEALVHMSGGRVNGIFIYKSCTKTFRREEKLQEHEEECEGTTRVRQCTVERAAQLASQLVYQGSIEHDIIYNPRGSCIYLDEMNIHTEEDSVMLEQGWAERPADGVTTGRNSEPRYRELVDKWIDIGEKCKERSMTAGMMLRTIRVMFPRNYDFPTERHIKNRISARAQAAARKRLKEKKGRDGSATVVTGSAATGVGNVCGTVHTEVSPDEFIDRGDPSRVDADDGGVVDATDGISALSGDIMHNEHNSSIAQALEEIGGYVRPPGVPSPGTGSDDAPISQLDPVSDGFGVSREPVSGTGNIVEEQGPVATSRAAIRQGVAMNAVYANGILSILGEDPAVKRTDVYGKLISKLGMSEDNLPSNFPSVAQVRNKVSNFRRAAAGNEERGRKRKRND